MRVVYNACFGGFGLSELALVELAKLKGVDLTGMKFEYSHFSNEDYSQVFDCPRDRTDADLVSVVDTLGERASSSLAKLCIAEIPDGVEYEIDDYDGFESVVPPRSSW